MNDLDRGRIAGILIGQGSFGGDGRKAQLTLRMHGKHHPLLLWLVDQVPGSRLYGPYSHGGRTYYQWMCRDLALKQLISEIGPAVAIDPDTHGRLKKMAERYRLEPEGAPQTDDE